MQKTGLLRSIPDALTPLLAWCLLSLAATSIPQASAAEKGSILGCQRCMTWQLSGTCSVPLNRGASPQAWWQRGKLSNAWDFCLLNSSLCLFLYLRLSALHGKQLIRHNFYSHFKMWQSWFAESTELLHFEFLFEFVHFFKSSPALILVHSSIQLCYFLLQSIP